MDEQRFRAFYQETAAKLRAYIRRASGDATLADDIFQEAFLRFLKTSPATLDERQQRSYLYRTATSLLVDHWRSVKRQRRWRLLAWLDNRTDPSPNERLDVRKLFAELEPREQALLWLAYVEGFDHAEIGATLGLRQASVRVVLHRARRKMEKLLTEHGLSSAYRLAE